MIVIRTLAEMRLWSKDQCRTGVSIGFVPTMGALHDGHVQLLNMSRTENMRTVLSVFVNPTQFNNSSDYDLYPRDIDADLELARSAGTDCVFFPASETMYPRGFDTSIDPGLISRTMEGEFRPGHFQGVATVVVKLLNVVNPRSLYLGQKDYQQLAVLRHVAADLNLPASIVSVPTVRHTDGLAMSSRNVRLTKEHRIDAVVINQALQAAYSLFVEGERDVDRLITIITGTLLQIPSCSVEYVRIVDAENLHTIDTVQNAAVICLAAYFGDVRLIDNIILDPGTIQR